MENEEKKEDVDLTPRGYQSLLLEKCKQRNTILYLPTGAGKTYIAVMLIKHMSGALKGNLESGGKRTFVMVNTVALVSQQADYLRRHTPFSVGHFSGDMNVDYWSKAVWRAKINQHQILVMTAQIFRDILLHKYFNLRNVNLLVFDECHHAVSDHIMAQIMGLFSDCPAGDRPHVLGLTATLLNSDCSIQDIPSKLDTLEKTYRSTIVTVDDDELVREHSTNPNEECYKYNVPEANRVIMSIQRHLVTIIDWVMAAKLEVSRDDVAVPAGTLLLDDCLKTNKKLKNIILDVKYHMEKLGLYGGSIAALKHIVQLERIKSKAEDEKMTSVVNAMMTTLTMVRKLAEDTMSDYNEKDRIFRYSTPQVLRLIQVLRAVKPAEGDKPTRGIIFVERRFSAKVLYMILKYLKKVDSYFDFLEPDFIVGFQNNPYNCTREGALEKKWNSEAIYRFNSGHTNIIVSSNVLEEGIDIPQCNLVVKFDLPLSYRSYIQSKGRARKKPSLYAILVSEEDASKFMGKYNRYQKTEQVVKEHLNSKKEPEETTTVQKLTNEGELEPPYIFVKDGGFSKVTMNSAVSLVNRYCSTLPQDKFTQLVPYYFLKKYGSKSQCLLQLPINSPVKDTIEGNPQANKRLAKQSVSLETCKRLHKAGELDDNLLPVQNTSKLIEDLELFVSWEDEEIGKDEPKPGTKKKKRSYNKKFPDSFCNCAPESDTQLYLHVIQLTPGYPRPPQTDSRKFAFYSLIEANQEFAILSSKKLPQICDFPVFLNIGQIDVKMMCNEKELVLSQEEISKLRKFNTMLFYDLLDICRTFMIVDLENKEDSYFVVPMSYSMSAGYNIDWDIVNSHPEMAEKCVPSDESRINLQVTPGEYQLAVVSPWYRSGTADQKYVVSKICYDLSPQTPFPTKEFTSFEHYYQAKYSLELMCSEQPLLEVKAISNKLNCLKPRAKVGHTTSKRRRQELQEDFEELFIPELCYRYTFPAVLWLKSTCLPTILYRLTSLVLAEELRLQIARELRFPIQEEMKFEPLPVDPACMESDEPSNVPPQSAMIIPNFPRLGDFTLKSSEPLPWDDSEREPVDVDREFMENVTLMDVMYYHSFISKKVPDSDNPCLNGNPESPNGSPSQSPIKSRSNVTVPIKILEVKPFGKGPQLYQILQALTTAPANDIINMERLETLGDSFLKFSVSLFLFISYPNVDEGKLTEIKGKIVGNRNLYYCGKARDICKMVKVHDFSPRNDWVPPGFCVPRKIQQIIREVNLCPSLLYEVSIPKEDQLEGVLSAAVRNRLQDQLVEWDRDNNFASSAENYIGMQSVSDKSVADCVEALLGAYLKGYGVEGAAKLLGWFNIIPPEKANVVEMLTSPPDTACVTNKLEDVNFHLNNAEVEKLEEILQYNFQDRSFLLQALSHASYVQNRVTDCYQRLEFLGDAILDFLVTCHIYETCGNLSPGELTDLRSSLVNNITFGCLAVRNGFQKFCKYESSKLFDKIDTFVKFQEGHNHEVSENVLFLLEEDDCPIAESVDVPKVLGDLLESIAAAVYLDSGKSLETVWKVFYRIMENEIKTFSQCVPKQPVRMLHELCQSPQFTRTKTVGETGMVMVTLELKDRENKKVFHGFGVNKANAKRAAAKMALKYLC